MDGVLPGGDKRGDASPGAGTALSAGGAGVEFNSVDGVPSPVAGESVSVADGVEVSSGLMGIAEGVSIPVIPSGSGCARDEFAQSANRTIPPTSAKGIIRRAREHRQRCKVFVRARTYLAECARNRTLADTFVAAV